MILHHRYIYISYLHKSVRFSNPLRINCVVQISSEKLTTAHISMNHGTIMKILPGVLLSPPFDLHYKGQDQRAQVG